jgi:7,8-dihydro-6-hydroxymethylpterin dimethyltransferase
MVDHNRRLLIKTTSLCPVCLKPIDAWIVREEEEIFLEKLCKSHDRWKTVIWRGEPRYEDWTRPKKPVIPEIQYSKVQRGCPFDCGLCASHRQYPCSVLLELTDRCNLHCPICFANASPNPHAANEADMETIGWWYDRVMQAAGPCNIQLSGGEPTLRDDLTDIIALGYQKGFHFIQVNTNGLKLANEPDYGKKLRNAGLATVFLQFDGTEDAIYSALRGRPLLQEKTTAVERCKEAGLGVILVPTLVPGVNIGNIGPMIRFAIERASVVRGIHFQPISYFGRHPFPVDGSHRITLPEVMTAIKEQVSGIADRWNFLPPGCENERCSFHGSFIVMPDGRLRCTSPSVRCCLSNEDGRQGLLRSISTVARQWSPAPFDTPRCKPAIDIQNKESHSEAGESFIGDSVLDLNTFLDRGTNYGFSISCMVFQDVWNLDIERLRDCCISVMSPDGHLVPFCAYNLTSETGETLYRNRY